MCQPGRPAPSGVSQNGSPGRIRPPQQRIEWVSLARARRGRHRVRRTVRAWCRGRSATRSRTFAVLRDVVVDVLVDPVGGTAGQQFADRLGDLGDRLDGTDVLVGRQHVQGGHVVAEQRDLTLRQGHPVLAGVRRSLQQRIVDVGDVLHVSDGQSVVAPDPLDEVEREVGRRVAEMGGVVGSDAADVHAGQRCRRAAAARNRSRCRTA